MGRSTAPASPATMASTLLPPLSIPALLSYRGLKQLRLRSSGRPDRRVQHRQSNETTLLTSSDLCLIPARQLTSRRISNGIHRLFVAGREVISLYVSATKTRRA